MSASSERPEILYVGDPLCSWCWGFAPALRRLRATYPDELRFSLWVGGLRTGPRAQPLDPNLRAYLESAWREVERRSGQPFDYDFLERADFDYDTEPACRAVVAARTLRPGEEFDYNESLQEAFYHRGLDPTAKSTFLSVARERGFSDDAFESALESEAVAEATRGDFEKARELGVLGFPTTLLRQNGGIRLLAGGWVSPEDLLERVGARLR